MSKRGQYKRADCSIRQLSGHPDDVDMSRINSVHVPVTHGLWLWKCLDFAAFSRAINQVEMGSFPFDGCLSAAG